MKIIGKPEDPREEGRTSEPDRLTPGFFFLALIYSSKKMTVER